MICDSASVSEAPDRDARGLRLGRDDGERLPDEGVEERGLAGVGAAGEDDDAAAGHDGEVYLETAKPAPVDWCGLRGEWLATVYSPTDVRRQYHRRCRA